MNDPIIVISTGRSGSTFLCNLLMQSRHVAAIQELWSYRTNRQELMKNGLVSGPELWEAIDQRMEPDLFYLLSNRLIPTADYIHKRDESILFRSTLPRLFNNLRLAYVELQRFCTSLPLIQKRLALNMVLEHLTKQSGRSIAVEKTGSSARYTDDLLSLWPDSKIIFLFRDGRNVALSKSIHSGLVYGFLKRRGNKNALNLAVKAAKSKFTAEWLFQIQLSFAREWSNSLVSAMNLLRNIRREKLLLVRYEELFVNPNRLLKKVFEFVLGETVKLDVDLPSLSTQILESRTDYRILHSQKQIKLTRYANEGLKFAGYL